MEGLHVEFVLQSTEAVYRLVWAKKIGIQTRFPKKNRDTDPIF